MYDSDFGAISYTASDCQPIANLRGILIYLIWKDMNWTRFDVSSTARINVQEGLCGIVKQKHQNSISL